MNTTDFAIDCEFIDTPTCSALISLAIVDRSLDCRYFEFDFPSNEVTPWLATNVIPHLEGGYRAVSFAQAAQQIKQFIGMRRPRFWLYYGAYDWYWFNRVLGGFMNNPWSRRRYTELADHVDHLLPTVGPEHHALNDAVATMRTVHKITGAPT